MTHGGASIVRMTIAALFGAAGIVAIAMIIASTGSFDLTLGALRVSSSAIETRDPSPIERAPGRVTGNAQSESSSTGEASGAPHRVRRVVIVIGDGFGVGGLSAASTLVHGPSGGFAVESLPVVGMVRTTAANNLITDSAAAATAMFTGVKTHRGVVGQLPDGRRLANLFEVARAAGYATGAVTTSGIMDATPAGFTAHAGSRDDGLAILVQMLDSGCEVLVGAHWGLLEEPQVRAALDRVRSRGSSVVFTEEALAAAAGPVVALFDARAGSRWSGGPPLEVSTRAALRVLARDDDGFVLLVESEETDRVGHMNDTASLPAAARELDAAVRVVLEFAESHADTLVVVTADHDTGGPGIVGGSPDDPAAAEVRWLAETHTAIWVPLFATGPGAERFAGVMDNTDIGQRIAALLGVELRAR